MKILYHISEKSKGYGEQSVSNHIKRHNRKKMSAKDTENTVKTIRFLTVPFLRFKYPLMPSLMGKRLAYLSSNSPLTNEFVSS